jgi:hypothetical protein
MGMITAAAALLPVLLITGCGAAQGDSSSRNEPATPVTTDTPKTFIAAGAITVTAKLDSEAKIGGSCADNFKVMADNSIVVIKDAAGAPAASVTVSPGHTSELDYSAALGSYATKCQFLFTIPAVPDDSSTYFLTVDGHDAGSFTRTELTSPVALIVSDVFTPTFTKG